MADLRGDQLPVATLPLTNEPMSVWQDNQLRQADAEDVVVAIVPPITITVSRNLADTDNGKVLRCTSGVTLTVVTGLTDGFACMVLNRAGSEVTIGQGAGLTLDGDTTVSDDHFGTIVKDAAAAALCRASG